MRFKKTLCLVAGLLMAFGANNAFAQQATPQGVRVHIASPDSGAWVGIGKKATVNVLLSKGQAPLLDLVTVALNKDTLSTTATGLNGLSKFLKTVTPTVSTVSGITSYTAFDTSTANGTHYLPGSTVDTFRFVFPIAVGDPESLVVVANAFVSGSSDAAIHKLSNTNTTAIGPAINGATQSVGDKKNHFD